MPSWGTVCTVIYKLLIKVRLTSMEKLVYTVTETAQILNIGMNKAYELIQQQQIPNLRVGRKILIPKQSLEKWLVKSAVRDIQV